MQEHPYCGPEVQLRRRRFSLQTGSSMRLFQVYRSMLDSMAAYIGYNTTMYICKVLF